MEQRSQADIVESLVKVMVGSQVFRLKYGEIEIEMSQYAFAPKPTKTTIGDSIARWQAERPAWMPGGVSDPVDPNAAMNDDDLFATNLPVSS